MTTTQWKKEIAQVPADDRYAAEERAGIHEFDGRMARDDAERVTLEDYWRERGLWWFSPS